MKKLFAFLVLISVFFISGSMFVKHVEVQSDNTALIVTSDLGFSDIPSDNGL